VKTVDLPVPSDNVPVPSRTSPLPVSDAMVEADPARSNTPGALSVTVTLSPN
jgi:hypothetical protein